MRLTKCYEEKELLLFMKKNQTFQWGIAVGLAFGFITFARMRLDRITDLSFVAELALSLAIGLTGGLIFLITVKLWQKYKGHKKSNISQPTN